MQISIDDIEAAMLKMDEKKVDADQLAKEWIEKNRTDINQWLGK